MTVKVDLDGIENRLVAFPVPPGNYFGLTAAKGKLFWLSAPTLALTEGDGPPKSALQMYDLEKRKATDLFPAVENYDLAPDGTKLIVKADEKTYQVVEPKEGLKAGDGKLDLSGLRVELDPQAEWRQIFRETWRLYRDFFYLPDMGKIDWDGIRKRYEPLVAHVSHRFDLTYVLSEVAAELGSGHAYVGGGDVPKVEKVPVGLLGADLALDAKAGRWKVARILPGQNWNESPPLAAHRAGRERQGGRLPPRHRRPRPDGRRTSRIASSRASSPPRPPPVRRRARSPSSSTRSPSLRAPARSS